MQKPRKLVRKGRYRGVPVQAPRGVYLPDREQLVRAIAAKGATDADFEAMYGLSSGTFKKWREAYPGLDKAIESGRTVADGDVLFAMYKTATGHHYTEEQAVGGRDPQVMKVKRYRVPEFQAQKHWMAKRQKERWPASETVEIAGKQGSPLTLRLDTRDDIISAILGLVQSKIDPEKAKAKREASAS